MLSVVPCVEVAASEREPLMAAFRSDGTLEALLLTGSLADHLSMLADTRVLSVVESVVDAETIARLRRLEMLATRSAAVDHIDLDACRARGIMVTNVPSGDPTGATMVAAVADWATGREPANRVA